MEINIAEQILEESKEKEFAKESKKIELNIESTKEEISFLINCYLNKDDLADKFINLIPLCYDKSQIWWKWNNVLKKYEITDEVDILNLIQGASGANIISSKERTEIINAIKQRARRNNITNVKKSWIQFKKQIVDLETGERFEASPKFFITNPSPWKIGKNEDTPTMDRLFKEWVGEKYVQTLYEIIAFSLLLDYPIHRLFCLIGSGLNGKSTFLNLLRKFIGNENTCSTELDILLTSRFEITKLHKKLICLVGETDFKQLSKTSILKKLTGGDLIGFEYKNKIPFDDLNYAKIIISTNNLPETSDKTPGYYRRFLIIDFPNRFSEKKDVLAEIPDEEYNNLCLKSIRILIELLKKREFTNEGTIEERTKIYEDKSNPFDKFYNESIEENSEAFIWKFDFAKKFTEWCKENRFRQYSEESIGRKMKDKGIEQGQKTADWLIDGKNKTLRMWRGIQWREK